MCVRLTEEEEGHREALEAAKREHEDKLANAVQECLATERVSRSHWLPSVTSGRMGLHAQYIHVLSF